MSEGSKSKFNPAIEYISFLTQVVLVLAFFQGMLTGEKNNVRNPSILCGCFLCVCVLIFLMYLFLNGFEALQFFDSPFDTDSVYWLALITEAPSL